jgi:hypothetical protein
MNTRPFVTIAPRDPKPEYIKHTVIRSIAGAVWGNCNRHSHSQACALGGTLFRQIDFGHGEAPITAVRRREDLARAVLIPVFNKLRMFDTDS